MTKKRLEILLESCKAFPDPKADLEQYITPTPIVAEVLYLAFLKGDIEGKNVYDLGCGTGRFAIGCALLGAGDVTGFDIDGDALDVARENADTLGVSVRWVKADVNGLEAKCETVVQNPPFGVKKHGADRGFLDTAFSIGKTVYTIHKRETREYIYEYIGKSGGLITDIAEFGFVLPHTYDFHRKEKKKIKVDIYRIEVK